MRAISRFVRFAADHYLVVPIGSVLALAWANTSDDSYFRFVLSWSFAVNGVGMTLFFALVHKKLWKPRCPAEHWADGGGRCCRSSARLADFSGPFSFTSGT